MNMLTPKAFSDFSGNVLQKTVWEIVIKIGLTKNRKIKIHEKSTIFHFKE